MKKILKFLFCTKGRVNRLSFIISWVLLSAFSLVSVYFSEGAIFPYFIPLLLIPITIKRLHDINLRSFYVVIIYQIYGLLALQMKGMENIMLFNYTITMNTLMYYTMWWVGILLFYLMIKKGTSGVNHFGIDPTWQGSPRVPLTEFLSWRGIALKIGEKHK